MSGHRNSGDAGPATGHHRRLSKTAYRSAGQFVRHRDHVLSVIDVDNRQNHNDTLGHGIATACCRLSATRFPGNFTGTLARTVATSLLSSLHACRAEHLPLQSAHMSATQRALVVGGHAIRVGLRWIHHHRRSLDAATCVIVQMSHVRSERGGASFATTVVPPDECATFSPESRHLRVIAQAQLHLR